MLSAPAAWLAYMLQCAQDGTCITATFHSPRAFDRFGLLCLCSASQHRVWAPMDRLLRGHNVAYVAAASVVVLICWLVFVAVQPPPPAEEEEADTDTPAGRRAERHKRMLQRAKSVAASKAAEGRAAKVKAVRTTFLVETDAMDVNVTVVRPEDQHTLTIVTVHGAGANQFPQHAPPAWRRATPLHASLRSGGPPHNIRSI